MQSPLAFIRHLNDPETGRPFVLNAAEALFLKHAFRTRPDGRLLYPELLYSCPKKSGKTTFAALLLLYCTLNFGKFGEGYALANDFEQAQGRVFAAAKRIVEVSPALAQRRHRHGQPYRVQRAAGDVIGDRVRRRGCGRQQSLHQHLRRTLGLHQRAQSPAVG